MAGKNGGARPGAGRKPTGAKTKCYTITLSMDEAEDLEKRAAQMNKSVNKYLRDLIGIGVRYENVNVDGMHVDEACGKELIAAEPESLYMAGSHDEGGCNE